MSSDYEMEEAQLTSYNTLQLWMVWTILVYAVRKQDVFP